MARKNVFIKAALVLLAVWGCVWAVRAYAASRKITAERVNREVAEAGFEDWSGRTSPASAAWSGVTPRGEEAREMRSGPRGFVKLSLAGGLARAAR